MISRFNAACVVFLMNGFVLVHGDGDLLKPENFTLAEESLYVWKPSGWSPCRTRDSPGGTCCNACERTRNITCFHVVLDRSVPPFYCNKLRLPRPETLEECEGCSQDCVLSLWSDWSACTVTCAPGTRYRTRRVLVPPTRGGMGCGVLAEIDDCVGVPMCRMDNTRPRYTWKVSAWGSCRKMNGSGACGPGVKMRQVVCINQEGQEVARHYCIHSHRGSPEPANRQFCPRPCDCQVSNWSLWSHCSKTCYLGNRDLEGIQVRSRVITRMPQNGGLQCPPLRDTRPCKKDSAPPCPRFTWHSTQWGKCQVPQNSTEVCGSGTQMRQVYCIEEGDAHFRPVDERLCSMTVSGSVPALHPHVKRACRVPCPQDCQLGQWMSWQPCSKTCGTGGIHIRARPVLVRAQHGGKECGPLSQSRQCEPTECFWWHTGRWSYCNLNKGEKQCGRGSKVRNVYCLSARDEVLPDETCGINTKPDEQQSCRVPCPDECVVSDWSDWGTCSASCGVRGGVQLRSRYIADNGNSSKSCLPPEALTQTRPCNQVPCTTYVWQVTAWSSCQRHSNRSYICGENMGTRRRQVFCQKDTGFPTNDSFCDNSTRPHNVQTCNAPCPENCELSHWSSWSVCSKTCGRQSQRVRTRRVLKLPLHGGKACPSSTDANGVSYDYRKCKHLPVCHTFYWAPSPWGSCQVFSGYCGQGVQSRSITCRHSDGKIVQEGLCMMRVTGLPPPTEQRCFRPCPGDCVLSQWSDFTECTQTCGSNPGIQTRKRHILNPDPNLDMSIQCPDVTERDLIQRQGCGQKACPSFSWEAGPWSTCRVHDKKSSANPCGGGSQRRVVLCKRSDGVYVPNHYCDVRGPMPERHQSCRIICSVDCVVSGWSEWSTCSQKCGQGIRSRKRVTVVRPRYGGRRCPHFEEIDVCSVRNCSEFEWRVSQWSACQVMYGFACGAGRKFRNVTCPAGIQHQRECLMRGERPVMYTSCDIPCQGDCVLSEPTNWSACSCPSNNATRFRTRQILKPPSLHGQKCLSLKQTESCSCHRYRLDISRWKSCIPDDEKLCGKGTRRRALNCIRGDGVYSELRYCDNWQNISLSKPCQIECPTDCIVSPWSSWSDCSDQCGLTAHKSKVQRVMKMANFMGRQCPPIKQLKQNTTCNERPCYTYSWKRSDWSECSVEAQGCGIGEKIRTVQCERSDGTEVDKVFCLLNGEPTSATAEKMAEVSKKSDEELEIHTEQPCGSPCPGDCQVTEWSSFSPCFRNCSYQGHRGFKVRTRAIITPATGGKPCPNDIVQIKTCSSADMTCPVFQWATGPWNERGRRKVWCVTQGGLRVDGGCWKDTKPSHLNACVNPCGLYAHCSEGKCGCRQGFEGDGYKCAPAYGCVTNSHCVVNGTSCDSGTQQCLCQNEQWPINGAYCPVLRPTEMIGAATDEEDTGKMGSLFWYIIVAVLIAVFLLILIAALLFVRRQKRREKCATPHVKKIHNLDAKKNNEGKTMAPLLQKYTTNEDSSKNLREASTKKPLDVPTIKSTLGGYRSNMPSVNEHDRKSDIVNPLMYSKKDVVSDGHMTSPEDHHTITRDGQDYLPVYSPNHDRGLFVTYPRYMPDHYIVTGHNHARSVSPCLQTFRPASNAHLYENALTGQNLTPPEEPDDTNEAVEEPATMRTPPFPTATHNAPHAYSRQPYNRGNHNENMHSQEKPVIIRAQRSNNNHYGRPTNGNDTRPTPRSPQGQTGQDKDGLERLCDELVQGLQEFSGNYA